MTLNNTTKQLNTESHSTHDIFDRIFKRIITLSSTTIVRFINGVFNTDYPVSSTVSYNEKENVNDNLRKTLADSIITINGTDSYHLEAQMYKDDNSIMLRMFDYGYNHSRKNAEDIYDTDGVRCGIKLHFPSQVVIYLDSAGRIPDEYMVTLITDNNGEFTFNIPTIKFQEKPLDEITERNMIILLPFKLLKVRDSFKKAYESNDHESLENQISVLREIYESDIINTIEGSFRNGDISRYDMNLLISLTRKLFDHLYSKYTDLKEVEEMRFYDQSLDLEIDKYYDALEIIAQKDEELSQKDEELSQKDEELSQKDEEIARLKEELKKYIS